MSDEIDEEELTDDEVAALTRAYIEEHRGPLIRALAEMLGPNPNLGSDRIDSVC